MSISDFEFALLTPEKSLLRTGAQSVLLPGEQGQMGVLPGHEAMVALLGPGVVEVEVDSSADAATAAAPTKRSFFIEEGVAEVTPGYCRILAPYAQEANQLDRQDAFERVQKLEMALTDVMTGRGGPDSAASGEARDSFMAQLQAQLRCARARLAAASNISSSS
ncbi:MAG: F0F1 ATP synthase subunit epsilon [Alphaproteobacteria bacterium]|nr:MAG: F0F1 ATP synthase subunit epsilon [Alphaproteobacteria bacterium]